MATALFLSPHLDDVVFSCGGVAARFASAGWRTVLATAFTRSVVPATGFALACQLDKGLSPDLDYMALRREEDRVAADILSFDTACWLDLLEAPHRGYGSATALFGPVAEGDAAPRGLSIAFQALAAEFRPDVVFTPQGLGNHVDHQQVIAATQKQFPAGSIVYYRDTPYAIRQPDAPPLPSVPMGPSDTVAIGSVLDRKIAAALAYGSQIGFQFGGAAPLRTALAAFAMLEGNGQPAERFLGRSVGGLLHSLAA